MGVCSSGRDWEERGDEYTDLPVSFRVFVFSWVYEYPGFAYLQLDAV